MRSGDVANAHPREVTGDVVWIPGRRLRLAGGRCGHWYVAACGNGGICWEGTVADSSGAGALSLADRSGSGERWRKRIVATNAAIVRTASAARFKKREFMGGGDGRVSWGMPSRSGVFKNRWEPGV